MGTEDPKTGSDHYTQLREPLKAWAKDWTSLTGSARLDEERTNQTRNPDRGPKSPSPAACGCRAYSAVQATPCAMGFPDSGSFWPSSKALKPRKRRRTSAGAGSPALEKTAGLWIGLFQVPDVVYRYRSERDVVRRAQGSGFAITRCPHCCRLAEPPPLCCRSLARVHAWGHEVIQLSDMLASKLYATRSNFHELSHCQSTMKLHTPNPQMAKSS